MQNPIFKHAKNESGEIQIIELQDLDLFETIPEKEELLSMIFHLSDTTVDNINKDDNTQATLQTRRYFADTLSCYECGETGHTNRECPQRSVPICVLCAKKGHLKQRCPMSICSNCFIPGHKTYKCYNQYKSQEYPCNKCNQEHPVSLCPLLWRHYKLKKDVNFDEQIKKAQITKSCPICFSNNHFIDDCSRNKGIKFSIFNSESINRVKFYKDYK